MLIMYLFLHLVPRLQLEEAPKQLGSSASQVFQPYGLVLDLTNRNRHIHNPIESCNLFIVACGLAQEDPRLWVETVSQC